MVTLTMEELKQAVKEWADKRNIPMNETDMEFYVRHIKGPQNTSPSSKDGNYSFHVQVRGVEMPPYNGPYR